MNHIYIYIYGDFPKLWVPLLGVPIMRTIVFWGLYWGPLFWETTIYIYMYIRILNILLRYLLGVYDTIAIWLFLQIGGPFPGCLYTILGALLCGVHRFLETRTRTAGVGAKF